MTEITPGTKGYARFKLPLKGFDGGVTAFVEVLSVDEEYIEFVDDEKKYKILKEKFYFIEDMF